jgi:hypothetical protein
MSQKEAEVLFAGQSYPVSSLNEEARVHVANLQFVESEIARLNAQLLICMTARRVYQSSLKDILPQTPQTTQ